MEYEHQIGSEEMAYFHATQEGLSVNVHAIVNNDSPWLKGYDFTWQEVYDALNKYLTG